MSALFGRVFWMMLGPLLLAVSAFAIVSSEDGWLAFSDFAFLVILTLMLAARWLEFRGGDPQRATGEPATPADLTRYLMVTPIVGLAIWAIANVIGNGSLSW